MVALKPGNSLWQRYNTLAFLLPLVMVMAYCIIQAMDAPLSDYAGYYFGSRALLKGDFAQVYETYSLNQLIESKGYANVFVSYTPFPPFTALMYAAFTGMPVHTSKLVFNIVSCLLLVITLYRCIRFLSLPGFVLLLVPVLFFIPVRNNIFFGQAYLLLTVLLLEGFMAWKKGRAWMASLWWGMAIVFKLFPALILVFLLIRKQYRQALLLVFSCCVLMGMSVAVSGAASWKFYVLEILPRVSNGELNNSFTWIFQSAFMLVKNIFVYDELMNPGIVYDSPYLFIFILAVFKSFLIAGCARVTWIMKDNDLFPFALWIAASILVSPNGSTYSLVLWMIPLLAMLSTPNTYKWYLLLPGLFLLLVIANLPLHYFADFTVLARFPRLYAMIIFFGLLLLIVRIRPSAKVWLGLFILWFMADSLKFIPGRDQSSYLLRAGSPGLIFDYTVRDNKLVYYYLTDAGVAEKVTGINIQQAATDNVTIRDKQLYYGEVQVTNSYDWKHKPMVVNNSYIIYLSDKNRGPGFYTLRKTRIP